MYRRAIAICASGIALAAVAQAEPRTYESWSVSAALKQPTATQLTADIKENGAGITLIQKLAGTPPSPTTTWTYASNLFTGASASYEITARPGYDIKSVVLDGRTVAVAAGERDLKTVSFDNTRLLHTLVVNTVAEKYNVSTSVSPARKGAFSPASLKNIAYGTAKTVKVIPMKGWSIAAVTDNGSPVQNAVNNPDGTMTISFQNTVGPHALAATFSQIHAVTAAISPVGDRTFNVDKGDVKFELDALRSTSNVKPVTYTWALANAPDATYAKLSSTNTAKTLFTASKPGTYQVSLTVSDGTVSDTKLVTFIAQAANLAKSATCITCHKDAADINGNIVARYQTSRHATSSTGASCGDCHGNHSTGKIDPKVACATCHTASGIYTDWQAGHHGSATGHNTGTCQRCHATDGAIVGATVGWTGGYAAVLQPKQASIWTPNAPAASAQGISCQVCHDQHSGDLRTVNTIVNNAVVAWDPNQNGQKDQYDICTSCHTLTDNAGAVVGNYHDASSANVERTIADSHFDNSATGVGLATTTVEGYVIRAKGTNPCADCHNLHTADLTIQEQWAESAHAGKIKKQKEDALLAACIAYYSVPEGVDPKTTLRPGSSSSRTYWEDYIRTTTSAANGTLSANAVAKAAGVTGTSGPAWEHYNWDQTTSRGACQRCHTSTGIANYLSNPAGYDATGNGNDFSHLSGWTKAAGSPQNELLYCWGCHSDSQTGVLRNPGAITENYAAVNKPTTGTTGTAATVAYPNIDKSNVCMGCHLGREIGQNIKNITDADGVLDFVNSHYLTAGATIFNKSGYEFAGQDYSSYGFHKNVGMANTYNTGTNGPCVTCHMGSAEKHTFEASAATPACANCHGGLTDAALGASKEEFHLAMEELRLALEAKGIYFSTANPYFFTAPYVVGGTNTAFTNWAAPYGVAKWQDVMGAAFNYNMLEHDPGAYAHNRGYALKLIKDSIDFLADGAVDGQGASLVVAGVIASDEFAKATTHTAATTATKDAVACSTCHTAAPGAHFAGSGAFTPGPAKAQFVAPATQAGVGSCTDCHANGTNGTTSPSTIVMQYGESGHGNVTGDAWVHYDWRSTARNTCGRCHTSSGYANIMTGGNGMPFDGVNDANKAPEVLRCNGCHSNIADGTLYNPGPVTVKNTSGVTVTVGGTPVVQPNAQKSNGCLYCHSGAGNQETAWSSSRIASHHAVAGGTLFGTNTRIGYEFKDAAGVNLDYAIPAYIAGHAHPTIGMEEGGTGPCVGCHMPTKDHTFEVADATTQTIKSQALCNTCHTVGGPYEMTYTKMEEEKEGYNAAGAVLAAYIANTIPNYKAAAIAGGVTNADPTGLNNDRAAWYNSKLFPTEEKGAFAHNRFYTKRLMFDAIDWLQDGALNGSISTTQPATLPATVTADTWAKAVAWLGATRL